MKDAPGDRSPGELLRDLLERMVGKTARYIVGAPPAKWETVLSHYTNRELADAARVAPEARNTFYRRMNRYRRRLAGQTGEGSRTPGPSDRRQLERLGVVAQRRSSKPGTIRDVLRLIRRHGLTVSFDAEVLVSDESSYRELHDVHAAPAALDRGGVHGLLEQAERGDSPFVWERAFEALWRVVVASYGVPGMKLDALDELELELGRQPEKPVAHRRRPAA